MFWPKSDPWHESTWLFVVYNFVVPFVVHPLPISRFTIPIFRRQLAAFFSLSHFFQTMYFSVSAQNLPIYIVGFNLDNTVQYGLFLYDSLQHPFVCHFACPSSEFSFSTSQNFSLPFSATSSDGASWQLVMMLLKFLKCSTSSNRPSLVTDKFSIWFTRSTTKQLKKLYKFYKNFSLPFAASASAIRTERCTRRSISAVFLSRKTRILRYLQRLISYSTSSIVELRNIFWKIHGTI